ncbi:MAG: hypothetical protein E2576_06925 [Alcaligenaceae bacterium]|nr:hypothetical protein [Alcaligenaceae bacterium SAGV5]MPS53347.1 hypothetical protein [Alcaligenaceae bacterium SAGV3]MPT56445.1 hypothetical protein [Alcaligenaceae bacterium]
MSRLPSASGWILVAATAGCAAPPPVQLSEAPSAAKIRFVNQVDKTLLNLYPPTECNNGFNVINNHWLGHAIQAVAGDVPRRVGMLDPVDATDRNIAEIAVAPLQIVNVGTFSGAGVQCLGGLSFTAQEKTQYEVRLSAESGGRCQLTASRLENIDGSIMRVPVNDVGPLICRSARQ